MASHNCKSFTLSVYVVVSDSWDVIDALPLLYKVGIWGKSGQKELYKISSDFENPGLQRLEKFAIDNEYFSELQFRFREGVGCIEASFTILETINHMLERGSKVFGCFLTSAKLLMQFGLMGYFLNCSLNLVSKVECG